MNELSMNGDISKLLKKISEITASIGVIPKNGTNPDYTYVTEKDVVSAIRTKLVEKEILLIPCVVESSDREITLDGETTTVVKVVMSYTFFDISNGSNITTYYQGEGEDTLDKGIYKAITGCQKYALLKTFLIPTGDDPEGEMETTPTKTTEENNQVVSNDNTVENSGVKTKGTTNTTTNTINTQKAKEIYAMGKNHKDILESVLNKYGYKTTFQITENNYELITNDLKRSIA